MAIRVTGLRKIIKPRDGTPGFELDVGELEFNEGELVFVMGPNGSGKSLLLGVMAGEVEAETVVKVTTGAVHLKPVQRRQGVVRQDVDANLALDLSVLDNVVLRLCASATAPPRTEVRDVWSVFQLWLRPRTFWREHARRALKKYPTLLAKASQAAGELSLGQRQTLACVLATLQGGPLLLLDEFLSATDLTVTQSLIEIARHHAQEQNAAVVIVSHDVHMAAQLADRVLILTAGKKVSEKRRGRNAQDWKQEIIDQIAESSSRQPVHTTASENAAEQKIAADGAARGG